MFEIIVVYESHFKAERKNCHTARSPTFCRFPIKLLKSKSAVRRPKMLTGVTNSPASAEGQGSFTMMRIVPKIYFICRIKTVRKMRTSRASKRKRTIRKPQQKRIALLDRIRKYYALKKRRKDYYNETIQSKF